MNIENNQSDYEAMSMDFQIILIQKLNETLKELGIEDKTKRKQVCDRYIEKVSDFIDMGWFEGEASKVYPHLCFAKRDSWTDLEEGKVQKVLGPQRTSLLYETFTESIEWFFDEKEEDNTPEIKTGKG